MASGSSHGYSNAGLAGMTIRSVLAAAVAVGAAAFPAAAGAAPVTVNLRVEGASQTLFEGPVTTYGHAVQAASDSTSRQCDGTNNGANPSPGGTATTALVDGLSTVDTTWDGTWSAPSSDYFVTRIGPDSQTGAVLWGLLDNYQFTPVSGCQTEVNASDQVLWAYDAFNAVRFLRLSASATTVAPGAAGDRDRPRRQLDHSGERRNRRSGDHQRRERLRDRRHRRSICGHDGLVRQCDAVVDDAGVEAGEGGRLRLDPLKPARHLRHAVRPAAGGHAHPDRGSDDYRQRAQHLEQHDVTVTLFGSDPFSGVAKTYYTTGTNPADPTTASAVYDPSHKPVLANGEVIKYFSVNGGGVNEPVRSSLPAKVDSTPPATTDNVPAGWVASPVAVTLTASDGSWFGRGAHVLHGRDQSAESDDRVGGLRPVAQRPSWRTVRRSSTSRSTLWATWRRSRPRPRPKSIRPDRRRGTMCRPAGSGARWR